MKNKTLLLIILSATILIFAIIVLIVAIQSDEKSKKDSSSSSIKQEQESALLNNNTAHNLRLFLTAAEGYYKHTGKLPLEDQLGASFFSSANSCIGVSYKNRTCWDENNLQVVENQDFIRQLRPYKNDETFKKADFDSVKLTQWSSLLQDYTEATISGAKYTISRPARDGTVEYILHGDSECVFEIESKNYDRSSNFTLCKFRISKDSAQNTLRVSSK